MSFAALAFANPWVLLGLAALPAIWWLLRTTPPRPTRVDFPAIRILREVLNREQTPARTPWWLMAIRLLAAAAIITALAGPILNPAKTIIEGDGAVAIVVDNGWGAASDWAQRKATLQSLVREAETANRAVMILETARSQATAAPAFGPASAARERVAALTAKPYAPDRMRLLPALKEALQENAKTGPARIVWLADPLDYDKAADFQSALTDLARDTSLTVIHNDDGADIVGLRRHAEDRSGLTVEALALPGHGRDVSVLAYSGTGQRLGQVRLNTGGDGQGSQAKFELPIEIVNQISRLEIDGVRSAGAVHLLDARSRWKRVALISGEGVESDQPLLASLYYLQRALSPYADIDRGREADIASNITTMLERKASVLMLANIGNVVGKAQTKILEWVKKGGVLVRFAGPRLERAEDALLPVTLRIGGRTLGGALSWSTPQPLQGFDKDSLFFGLAVPEEVTIKRQVLADPASLTPDVKVWARLGDGTPLVTARRTGDGWLVLFHVTANSDWSNLPLSGLFVDMVRRLLTASNLTLAAGDSEPVAGDAGDSQGANAATVLAPSETLDGFGRLGPPPVTAQPLALAELETVVASSLHPPGYYGQGDAARSINLIAPKTELKPRPPAPTGASVVGLVASETMELSHWLFLAALALLLIDAVALMMLQGVFAGRQGRGARASAAAARGGSIILLTVVIGAGLVAAIGSMTPAVAQTIVTKSDEERTAFALNAALGSHFGYVITGNDEVDSTSERGLAGLSLMLRARTAVEPDDPIAIDIRNDELAFFPLIYWPIVPEADALDDATLSKIDGYMKQGGLIIFDTRDYARSFTGGASSGPGAIALQRLLAGLDIPPLEPVPPNHVLTKSFYLLSSFPGRWDGGALWVEAGGDAVPGAREARHSDGVSAILITSNDLAAAWAMDQSNRPLYAVVPGGEPQREQAFRTGINIAMYALTGNYKADQVHVPALLERLGQ